MAEFGMAAANHESKLKEETEANFTLASAAYWIYSHFATQTT
jgi:hypothetical protein